MYLSSKINLSKQNYFTILLSVFPLSFIAGNMIININVILFILSAFVIFGKELFNLKYHLLDKLIFSFFFLILITGIINDFHFYSIKLAWKGYFATIVKSIFFFKYLLIYLILRFLIEKEIINLKLFFVTCSLSSIFVSLDIFYQYYNGSDIFGYASNKFKLGGPFGDELIAGGYIQRFSIFSFFVIPLFYSSKFKKFLKYMIPILFIVFFVGIILSGNRMPLILFILSIFLIVLFQKQTRKYFLPFIIIFSLTFYILFSYNEKVKTNFISFYAQITGIVEIVINKDFYNKKAPPYYKEFFTFYDTWLIHKYIGGGIKNFRYYCHTRKNIDKNTKFVCNMHPHNYYLEILTETGLVGFFIISSVFLIILYYVIYKKYFTNSNLRQNNIIVPFIFLFIVEIFPFKSTGSFFTTGTATYLFLLMGILVGLIRKDILIEKKN